MTYLKLTPDPRAYMGLAPNVADTFSFATYKKLTQTETIAHLERENALLHQTLKRIRAYMGPELYDAALELECYLNTIRTEPDAETR